MSDFTRAEVCAVAVAEAFRGDGEILASSFGTVPAIGARLAKRTFAPGPADDRRHRVPRREPGAGLRPGARGARRRRLAAVPLGLRPALVRPPPRGDGGEPDRPLRQPQLRLHRPPRAAEGAAPRHARRAGQHRSATAPATGCRTTRSRPSSRRSTASRASATTAPRPSAREASRFHDLRRVVSNLGVFDFGDAGPLDAPRLRTPWRVGRGRRSSRPASSSPLPPSVPETRAPTAEELRLIREAIDPEGAREREVRA